MVRMNADELAEIDRQRGDRTRGAYLRLLLAENSDRPLRASDKSDERGSLKKGAAVGRGPAPRVAPPPARRRPRTPTDRAAERTAASLKCMHPVSRKIGTGCGLCGDEKAHAR